MHKIFMSSLEYPQPKHTISGPVGASAGNALAAARRAGARIANIKDDRHTWETACPWGRSTRKAGRGMKHWGILSWRRRHDQHGPIWGSPGRHADRDVRNWRVIKPGRDDTVASDVKSSGSCRGRWDLAGARTHERGHAFGLVRVSETDHGNLTTGTVANGACQMPERTLGPGACRGWITSTADARFPLPPIG